jgi:hypothetical protein
LYEAHRARAFALARGGSADAALAELNRGWGDEWPDPPSYMADVAEVRLLAGEPPEALEALRLAVRGAAHLEPRVPRLAGDCVRARPQLWRQAVRLAAEGGSVADRVRVAFAVSRARLV